ncbi:MAG: signal peptidase II [Oligoflexia bacterium]|nr:signal peptidase II [Oligoflexia bacterium]
MTTKSKISKAMIFSLSIVVLIVADQITKYITRHYMFHGQSFIIIDGLFNLTFVKNSGVAFGIGANATDYVKKTFFLGFPIVACIILLLLIARGIILNKPLRPIIAYALIFAGAIGNLIDRFYFGFVTDFLDFYWGKAHFPAFNIADSCISVAAGILILDFLLELNHQQKNSHK